MIDADLLEVLACPSCASRPPLRQEGNYLICTLKGHGFPIVNGIPHLVPEEAIDADSLEKLTNAR